MNYLLVLVLIPLAILMGFVGLAAFLWSLRSGQYEDLDGAADVRADAPGDARGRVDLRLVDGFGQGLKRLHGLFLSR